MDWRAYSRELQKGVLEAGIVAHARTHYLDRYQLDLAIGPTSIELGA